ncbi:MAG TPA: Fic family protein, partial [Candidatus Micrarchaeota archaeon]|nr:Fic family protein [Candidatus Micrarchaeota archaeon]
APPRERLDLEVDHFLAWFNAAPGDLDGLIRAGLAHLWFVTLHPFEDGNKRVSRLLLNKALFDSGYPLLNISKETQGYFDALIKSVEKRNEQPFVEFAYGRFLQDI